jgi:hypothetical protein
MPMNAPYRLRADGQVHVFDMNQQPWQSTPEPGLRLKPVRYDDERGLFLGLVGFLPDTRSGLHQHQGVATSFVIDGGLSDHHGSICLHEAGINLAGATHDAVSYQHTVLVSRLEGPVLYPVDKGDLSGLHAGSRHALQLLLPRPDVAPEINVQVDRLGRWQTGVPGLLRQTVFDYAGTGSTHRYVQLHAAPGHLCPRWRATALVELWVRGGQLWVNGRCALANSFVVIEVGAEVELAAPHGALVLAWSEGVETWLDAPAQASPPAQGASALAVQRSLFGF